MYSLNYLHVNMCMKNTVKLHPKQVKIGPKRWHSPPSFPGISKNKVPPFQNWYVYVNKISMFDLGFTLFLYFTI